MLRDGRRAPKGSGAKNKCAETETKRWERRTEEAGWYATHPVDVEASLLARGGGAVDPDHRHLLHAVSCVAASKIQRGTVERWMKERNGGGGEGREGERTVEGAAGEAEARDGRRHVVVERDDADAEDRGGRPRRGGLRRLRGRHGRRGAGTWGGRVAVSGLTLTDSNEARRGSFRSTLPGRWWTGLNWTADLSVGLVWAELAG